MRSLREALGKNVVWAVTSFQRPPAFLGLWALSVLKAHDGGSSPCHDAVSLVLTLLPCDDTGLLGQSRIISHLKISSISHWQNVFMGVETRMQTFLGSRYLPRKWLPICVTRRGLGSVCSTPPHTLWHQGWPSSHLELLLCSAKLHVGHRARGRVGTVQSPHSNATGREEGNICKPIGWTLLDFWCPQMSADFHFGV